MSVARTALVVGAGIGGLAAGVALRRVGWQVRIFERAANPRELGFALNLAPNAIDALAELGLADPLIASGHVTASVEVRAADGRVMRRLNIQAARRAGDTPSIVALRPVLHGTLLHATEPTALAFESEAVGFEATQTGVVLLLKGGSTASGDVLIGADGVGSVIRRVLRPDEGPPRRSGYWAVRGVARDVVTLLGALSGVAYMGRAMEAAAVRASRDAIYWYISLLADDLPIGDRRPRIVAERAAATLDDWFRTLVDRTAAEDLRLDELFDREPIASWGEGPVTLLGDAAHPMLPHAGQGAAQALEDAVALGLTLAPDGSSIDGLRRYERVRSARTRHVMMRGRQIAGMTTTRSLWRKWLGTMAVKTMPSKALLRGFYLAKHEDPHRELRRS